MKIGPVDIKPVAAPAAAERKNPAAAERGTAEASAQVDLSSAASLFGSADPTFDSAKVERVAQAIRAGQFKIDPEAIADKLILNAEELLGRKLS